MSITALIFTTQNNDGETFEEIFDVAIEARETVSGIYTALIQCSTDLTSDVLLASKAHESNLKNFGEVQDYESFETLAKQIEKSKLFANGSVSVAFETKEGRGAKKVVPFLQFKKGLSIVVKEFLSVLDSNIVGKIHTATFRPQGLELLTDLVNESNSDLIPVLKTSKKSNSIEAMFKKYVKENASNVVEMTPDLSDDDFEAEAEEAEEETEESNS